ncbi:hypothetical protein PMIN03_010929 [Paraphaeosphaeria minitans]|uniref:Uncharacterized protein n=1 Tax=Paraphaeosphaeria minitans TaxID=565426 RepID=A0A9P6KMZ7_9PLEO|nr:hypothetical protein PMIN01_10150 [Paraphaeosphaeria minitans]
MAGSGFSTIDNALKFTHGHQRTYEKSLYGMNSEVAEIHANYLDKNYNRPVVFGNGNNEQLPFAPKGNFKVLKLNKYDAVEAHGRAAKKSWGRKLTHPLLRLPSRVASLSISGVRYLGSVLGKAAHGKSVLGKRRRSTCGDCEDCNELCGGEWEHMKPEDDVPANNATNPNIHDYMRPPRKVRFGSWFHGGGDDSWAVDPRTGHRITTSPV